VKAAPIYHAARWLGERGRLVTRSASSQQAGKPPTVGFLGQNLGESERAAVFAPSPRTRSNNIVNGIREIEGLPLLLHWFERQLLKI
jgi:hypothetical protein